MRSRAPVVPTKRLARRFAALAARAVLLCYAANAFAAIGGLISSTLLGGIVTPVMYRLLPPKIEAHGPEQRDAALA